MIRISTLFIFVLYLGKLQSQTVTGPLGEIFQYRVVADKLSDPWEITIGHDKFLYVTEAKGYRISRINPVNGSKTLLLDLNKDKNFDRYRTNPQGGLMGLVLHPQLFSGKPFVYVAFVYNYFGSLRNDSGSFFKTKIVRYNANFTTRTLVNPVVLCDTLPGSNDHNGGRLLIAPVAGKDYLFYGIGDMGAGQFNNGARRNNAQRTNIYEGKVLRFNLEPDLDPGAFNKWIPNDNPFNNSVSQNAIWTLGHRNPQGLAYATISGIPKIYSVEHGPFSDDEVNIIERQKNYGHPLVVGYNDGNYNGLAAAATANKALPGPWQTSCPTITNENSNALSIGPNFKQPLKTFYPSTNSFLTAIITGVRNNNTTSGFPNGNSATWQSEAPSSIQVYTKQTIPGWNNSLLITTLKGGKLIRLKLNATGDAIQGDTLNYFKSANRFRDIAISDDGLKIYLAVDSSSVTSGPSAGNPQVSTNRGSILEFTYIGNAIVSSTAKMTKAEEFGKVAGISVSPNPANNNLRVNLNSSASVIHYTVTDIKGQILIKGTKGSKNFDINIVSLNKAYYILNIYNSKKENIYSRKFLKQ